MLLDSQIEAMNHHIADQGRIFFLSPPSRRRFPKTRTGGRRTKKDSDKKLARATEIDEKIKTRTAAPHMLSLQKQ